MPRGFLGVFGPVSQKMGGGEVPAPRLVCDESDALKPALDALDRPLAWNQRRPRWPAALADQITSTGMGWPGGRKDDSALHRFAEGQ